MPSYLFTFSSHPSEPKLFNTFLTIFFSSELLKSFQEYSFNIEKDNTIDQHLHVFFTSTLRDTEKVYKQLSCKEFKQFSTYLKNKATKKQYGFDVRLVGKNKDRDDRKYTIGYCNKDAKHVRDNLPLSYHNIDQQEILEAVEYYFEYSKIQKVNLGETHDIRILNSKNAHISIIKYIEDNELETTDQFLYKRMECDGIFSDFLSNNQKASIQRSIHAYIHKDMEVPKTLWTDDSSAYDQDLLYNLQKKNSELVKRIKELEGGG